MSLNDNSKNSPSVQPRDEIKHYLMRSIDLIRSAGVDHSFVWLSGLLTLRLITTTESDEFDEPYRWPSWSKLPPQRMVDFVYQDLFPYLQNTSGPQSIYNSIVRLLSTIFQRLRMENHPDIFAKVVAQLKCIRLYDRSQTKSNQLWDAKIVSRITLLHLSEVYYELLFQVDEPNSLCPPHWLIHLIVQIIRPEFGKRIYNPYCRNGSFFIEAGKYIKDTDESLEDKTLPDCCNDMFFGYLDNLYNFLISLLNITVLHHITTFSPIPNNVLSSHREDIPESEKFDFIFALPPFGVSLPKEIQNRFPVASRSSELLFLQHIMTMLKKNGRAAIILPENVLRRRGKERKINERLLKEFNLHTIISLPSGIFRPQLNLKTSILCFNNDGPTEDIWFYQFNDLATKLNKKEMSIGVEAITDYEEITDCLTKWKERKESDKSWTINVSELSNYDINPKYFAPKFKEIEAYFSNIDAPSLSLEEVTDKICTGLPYTKDITISKEQADTSNAIPVLRVADIQSNLLQEPERLVSPEKMQHKRHPEQLRQGGILHSVTGIIGKVALCKERFAGSLFSNGLVCIRCSERLNPRFLFYYFQSRIWQMQLERVITGTTIPHLRLTDLRRLVVPVPPLEIQEEVIAYCSENPADAAEVLEQLLADESRLTILRKIRENISLNWLASLDKNRISSSDVELWLSEKSRPLYYLLDFIVSKTEVYEKLDAVEGWIRLFGEVSDSLRKGYQNPSKSESLAILEQANNLLMKVMQRNLSRLDKRTKNLLTYAIKGIQCLIYTEIEGLFDQTQIKITLIKESIPVSTPADLTLCVKNSNPMTVYDIRIMLTMPKHLQGDNFNSSTDIHSLSVGEEHLIKFPVFSDAASNYLAKADWELKDLHGGLHKGSVKLDIVFDKEKEHAYKDILRIPYITGNPVDTPDMFFGREDILEFLRKNLVGKYQNNVILLQGNRRTGKSSLLKHVVDINLLENAVPVYIDCQGLGTLDEWKLFYKFARNIAKKLRKSGIDVNIPQKVDIASDDAFWDFSILLESYQECLGERQLVLLLDEFEYIDAEIEKGNLDPRVPENFRHLFQHQKNLAVVLTGSYRLTKLREEYWSALFGIALEKDISVLDEADARALITKPLEQYVQYTRNAVSRIIELTACHPYFIQVFCHTLIDELNKSRDTSLITLQRVENAVPLCIDNASGHIQYLSKCAKPAQQRFILRLVAERGSLSMQEINTEFQKRDILTSARRIGDAINHLREYELLTMKKSASQTDYCFKFALFQNWVKNNIDLDKVASIAREDI